MKNSEKFGNGCTFKVLPNGQKVDDEGFLTSSKTSKAWFAFTCVSAKKEGDKVLVRSTRDASKTTLSFTTDEWNAFVAGVKEGELSFE